MEVRGGWGRVQRGAVMVVADDDTRAVERWLEAERLDDDVRRTLQTAEALLVLK
jgi:hypothetical protein